MRRRHRRLLDDDGHDPRDAARGSGRGDQKGGGRGSWRAAAGKDALFGARRGGDSRVPRRLSAPGCRRRILGAASTAGSEGLAINVGDRSGKTMIQVTETAVEKIKEAMLAE